MMPWASCLSQPIASAPGPGRNIFQAQVALIADQFADHRVDREIELFAFLAELRIVLLAAFAGDRQVALRQGTG